MLHIANSCEAHATSIMLASSTAYAKGLIVEGLAAPKTTMSLHTKCAPRKTQLAGSIVLARP